MKNIKFLFKILLGLFLLFGGIFFFIEQRKEVIAASQLIRNTSVVWIFIGALLSLGYIVIHGFVYKASFEALSHKLPMGIAIKLFLKRNFVGVFLPAGGFTSIALFRNETANEGISKSITDFASVLYSLVNLLSLLLLSIFVLFFWGLQNATGSFLLFLGSSFGLWAVLIGLIVSFYRKTTVYRLSVKYFPSVASFHHELVSRRLLLKPLIKSLVWATVVELIGILHLYVSMLALHLEPSVEACLIVYTVATLFYCFSPFMKGVGIVEVSMVVLLGHFGYTNQQAISISLLYRIFEFWAPLLIGGISFFLHKDNILIRVIPAIFIFISGLAQIVSAVVPSHFFHKQDISFIFGDIVLFSSNIALLLSGIVFIICSIFLIRGLRAAWFLGFALCLVIITASFVQHVTYADAVISFLVILILLYSYRHYFVSNRKKFVLVKNSLILPLIIGAFFYGIIGFYILHPMHFAMGLSIWNVMNATIESFVFLNVQAGVPTTFLGQGFIYSLNFLGAWSISLFIYLSLKPVLQQNTAIARDKDLAQELLKRYGRSPVDYFKTYGDKSFFFNDTETGFIAYKTTIGFAVVLEGPVCENDRDIIIDLIQSFERYCRKSGLKVTYYRVDQKQLELYEQLGKKHFLIGEEAIVDVNSFNLQGKKRKSLRNAVNNIERKGYHSQCYRAPLSEEFIKQLRLVSDSWLIDMKRSERVFSQGMFDEIKIRDSDVITLEDATGKIIAFLNIIPNYAPNESTYDLIRKTEDAPGGNMDILLLRFMDYCREEGFDMLNMGLAPLSGFDKKKGMIETTISFLYNKHYSFRSSRGLRDFKEKYEPHWVEKYIVYTHDIDLLAAPLVINKVMRMKKTDL